MSKLVTCALCSKNVQESAALPSFEYTNTWYCEPCAHGLVGSKYQPLAEHVSNNNALLDAVKKAKDTAKEPK